MDQHSALCFVLPTGIILAYFVAALAPNMEAANAILPTYVVTCLYFGGLLMTFDSMPPCWAWYSNIDFIRYGWGTLMMNQFQDNDPIWVDNRTVLEFYGVSASHASSYHETGAAVADSDAAVAST